MTSSPERCGWCTGHPLYLDYHDNEWGVPCYDERTLFEMLILEGAQAGLNWLTILKKRSNYRLAFDGFDLITVAGYGQDDVARLLADEGIVRNRLKIEAAIRNARGLLKIREEEKGIVDYLWSFVNHRPIQNKWRDLVELPDQTSESQRMSRDLKKRGFNFVGPTICYAFMQATGMVNDHLVGCYRHQELSELSR